MDNTPREPINKLARIVTGKSWDDYTPEKKNNLRELWDDSPPTKPVPSTIKNLIGFKKGRLTVVGYLGFKQIKNGLRRNKWLVRCICGRYEVRTQDTLMRQKTAHIEDMCQICQKLQQGWKRNADVEVKIVHFPQYGFWVIQTINIKEVLTTTGFSQENAVARMQDFLIHKNILGKLVVKEVICSSTTKDPSEK